MLLWGCHHGVRGFHPDVSKEDAATAWSHCIACTPAFDIDPDRYIVVGIDGKGRLLELIAIRKGGGLWLVIHVQYPPQNDIIYNGAL